ncbi:MAG: A/G-specific adenine glycosylase [Saprospiraceae bacterium]
MTQDLLNWHKDINRNLPWKVDSTPYKIWLSEIILQQTRVAQGMPYYLKFIKIYPTIIDLANAPQNDILLLWQGLGYYSRARNMHHAAITVRDDFGGIFPTTYNDVLMLKGVGDYTASAIMSFAYGKPYAVVDGNVIRVVSRYFGISEAVDVAQGKAKIKSIASKLIENVDPAKYNQAIMDFGALQCTPKSPNCGNCPLSNQCQAHLNEVVNKIPYKSKKIKKVKRYLHYFNIRWDDNMIVQQRTEGIWKGLYELPCIENKSDCELTQLQVEDYIKSNYNFLPIKIIMRHQVKHILTHQTLNIRFYQIVVPTIDSILEHQRIINAKDICDYPLPIVISKFLNSVHE